VGSIHIALDVPNDFDASDPETMAKLVQSVTLDMTSRKGINDKESYMSAYSVVCVVKK